MKKVLCLIAAVAMVFAVGAQIGIAAPGVNFDDVKETDWFYPYIELLAQKDLVKGTSGNTYSPSETLKVDEFIAFALRTLGKDQENAEGYWAQNYIDEAIRLNLIARSEFPRYDGPISREEIAKIVVRASDYEYTDYERYDNVFSDLGSADEKEYILKALELGVLAGYEDGTFRPANTATRAEASTMVARLIDPLYRVRHDGPAGISSQPASSSPSVLAGNVTFDPETDLDEEGLMTQEKAYEFAMEYIDQLRIEIGGGSTVVVKGDIPPMPQGFQLETATFVYADGYELLGFCSTDDYKREETKVPNFGAFEIDTSADPEQVFCIETSILVSKIGMGDRGITVGYFIRRNFKDEADCYFEMFVIGSRGRLDYSLVEGIWGW